jgi:PKD repeat protein
MTPKVFTHTALACMALFAGSPANMLAQVMINDGYAEACSGVLYDTSGQGGSGYGPAEDFTLTLCPDDGTNVFLEWINFELDPASFMTIYDGDSNAAPVLAYSATGSFLGAIHLASSNNASGCLTLHFVSSANPDSGGIFGAIIGCGQPCEAPIPVVNPLNPSPLSVCPGEEVDFSAEASVSAGAEIELYQWDFNADGTVDLESDSPNAAWTFDTPGIELVQLSLVDADGCESVQPTNYFVYISTEPEWNTTVVETACTGEDVVLSVDIAGVAYTLEPGNDFGEAISLPDNVGECFVSEISINSFLPGAVLLDAGDGIENFFVNMEHSFLGDLDVTFICPNGQELLVSSYPGPGTSLGVPIFGDTPPEPGTGYDYFWSADATLGTWATEPGGADGSLPSGTYSSETSWGALDGCPLNGIWQLEICDLWAADNGFVFEWGIDFADTLYPVTQSFTPQFGLLCDSTFWEPGANSNTVLAGDWNCADVTVTNGEAGPQTYTATAINNFGCTYSQTFEVEYVEFSPTIQASSDVFCGQAVELELVLANEVEGDVSVVWGPEEFLSDTVGTSVFVSGLDEPELFTATVGQSFDAYPGLLCQAQSQIVIGTCEIIIPNVVSPYGSNSLNDRFAIPGIQSYPNVQLTVMNRWGTVVFQSDDFAEQPFWDCAADGASSGVYYYVLTIPVEQGPLVVTDINGQGVEYEGEGPFVFEGIFHIVD